MEPDRAGLYHRCVAQERQEQILRTHAIVGSELDLKPAPPLRPRVRFGCWPIDNGGPLGSANNFPLRGHKATAWEGGVRGVAFVRGTNDKELFPVPAGSSTMELMHSTDWMPTLSSLAGAPLEQQLAQQEGVAATTPRRPGKPLDGVDQWGVIARGEATTRKIVIHNCNAEAAGALGGAIRMGQYKLLLSGDATMQVKGQMPQTPPPGFDPSSSAADSLVCPPPKAMNGMWLFDILKDPRECTNLAGSQPQALKKILEAFDQYRKTAVADLAQTHGQTDPASNPAKHWDKAWGPWSSKSSKCTWS